MTPCDLSSQFTNAGLTFSLHDTFKIISESASQHVFTSLALTPDISHRSFSATRDAAIDSLVVPGCPEHTELNLKQIFSFYTKWGIWNIPWGKFCLEMLWRNVSITSSWPAAKLGLTTPLTLPQVNCVACLANYESCMILQTQFKTFIYWVGVYPESHCMNLTWE